MDSRFRSFAIPGLRSAAWSIGAFALALLVTAPVRGQCAGDCNGDNEVAIHELILGVGIALEAQDIADCPELDSDDSDAVEIDELVGSVGNSIEGCPAAATPTPTATTTPTVTPTATVSELCGNGDQDTGEECDDGSQCEDQTTDCTGNAAACDGIGQGSCAPRSADGCQANCALSVCGDRIVDNRIEDPETCDDGNTDERTNDVCPANCRIARCDQVSGTITANVDFDTTPDELLVGGLQIFVRYPDGVVSIPGRDNSAAVQARITSALFSVQPNDLDFALSAIAFDQSQVGQNEGTAFTIELDACGAEPPSAGDFDCVVETASDPQLADVTDQVTCSVSLP